MIFMILVLSPVAVNIMYKLQFLYFYYFGGRARALKLQSLVFTLVKYTDILHS